MTNKEQKLTKQERKNLAQKEFEKIRDTAWKEYEKIREPAWKEFEKIEDTAWKKFEKKCEEIDKEVEEPEKIKIIDGHKYKLVEETK
jgi:hypothetical protein